MSFFDGNTSIRLHQDQKEKINILKKKYPMLFKSDSDIIRIAINYYYTKRFLRGELDEFEIDK